MEAPLLLWGEGYVLARVFPVVEKKVGYKVGCNFGPVGTVFT